MIALAGGVLLVIYSLLQAMYWYNQRDGAFGRHGGSPVAAESRRRSGTPAAEEPHAKELAPAPAQR
ncbi:MAG: hypothetical protein Q7T82_13620 [Armatimonadota bacterium]|nr:hypothetical protein [Armatimonadota bacterium]